MYYYIDRSVLPQNTPLVKFIRNYIRDPSGIFFIHTLTSEDIDDVISRFFAFVQTVSEKWRTIDWLYRKKEITRWFENVNFIFSC